MWRRKEERLERQGADDAWQRRRKNEGGEEKNIRMRKKIRVGKQ